MKRSQPARVRTGFIDCPKQTRMRALLLLALRPEGIKISQAIQLGIVENTFDAMTMMAQAEYLCGYDVRRSGNRRTRNADRVTYYLVGRHRWTGEYRSFRVVDDRLPNVRNDKSKLEPA